jgi:acyl carrier protein
MEVRVDEQYRLPMGVEFDPAMFAKVQKCFCDALEVDADECGYYAKVLDDLGAESLDLLDVVFRLERAFDVQIPRGGVEARAKMVDGKPGEVDGKLTAIGAEVLRKLMPEVPEAEIFEGMKTTEIPSVFRVGTFYVLVWVLVTVKAKEAEARADAAIKAPPKTT